MSNKDLGQKDHEQTPFWNTPSSKKKKTIEYNFPACLCSVDLEKTVDSLELPHALGILEQRDVIKV